MNMASTHTDSTPPGTPYPAMRCTGTYWCSLFAHVWDFQTRTVRWLP